MHVATQYSDYFKMSCTRYVIYYSLSEPKIFLAYERQLLHVQNVINKQREYKYKLIASICYYFINLGNYIKTPGLIFDQIMLGYRTKCACDSLCVKWGTCPPCDISTIGQPCSFSWLRDLPGKWQIVIWLAQALWVLEARQHAIGLTIHLTYPEKSRQHVDPRIWRLVWEKRYWGPVSRKYGTCLLLLITMVTTAFRNTPPVLQLSR